MTFKLRAWLLFLIFLTGYVSMSLELVVMRQLSFYVGSSAMITSIIIATFLGFMSLGYFLGSAKKLPKTNVKNILFISFVSIAIMTILASSFTLITQYFVLFYKWEIYSSIIQTFIYSFVFLSIAPFFFGYNTALLSRYLHKYNTNYTGKIMAWDTIGSVLGSLATTLILMPFIGVNYTILLITVLSLVGALIVKPKWYTLIIIVAILIPGYWINSNSYLKTKHHIIVNNANSTIAVTNFGDERVLLMNGLPMSVYNQKSGTTAEYVNYINDNFIYNMPTDKRRDILILGAGGFTVGLRDTYNNYFFVDIEKTLKDVSEKQFLNNQLTSNKHFIVQDASQYLKNNEQEFDMILLDVYSNSYQVPEDLITVEFMERIRARIKPDGVIIMNMITSPSFNDKYTRVFDNTFRAVFPNNTSRQVIGYSNPWVNNNATNIIYVHYNKPNDGRVYTINKTPVVYDRF